MPGRATAFLPLTLLALAAANVVRAESPATGGGVQAAIIKAQEAAAHDDCPGLLAALDPVLPELEQGVERTTVQRMRLVCLGMVGRAGDLSAVQRELAATMPRDGVVKAFGALIAAQENRFADAAEQIATVADTAPRSLDILTGSAVQEIWRRLVADHAREPRARMLIALARADWEPSDIPELRMGFAEGAIGALIDQGESAEAEGLLERIDQPEQLTAMAIDRHYAKLWPVIEARLGPSSATSIDRFAREKLALYGNSPDSEVALRDAANAMLLLGRFQDVIDLTDGLRIVDGMGRDAVRTVLYRARALAALGRNDEVDRLLAEFLKLDLHRAPAASMALVSYAEFLDEIGRPAEALAVTRDARIKAADMLTDLGKRWLDRSEICSLSALGRVAEANRAIDALKQRAGENQPATIEALLCARRDAEASGIAVKAFEDEDVASDLLLQFQPGASLWAPAPSRLRDLWLAFFTRPEIRAAFERKGRILPRILWPAPRPRDIPRRPSAGATLT